MIRKLLELQEIQKTENKSLAQLFVEHYPQHLRLKALKGLSPQEQEALMYDWSFHARPSQMIPDTNWNNWLLLAGRGFGKSRTGAETIRHYIERNEAKRVAFVGPTAASVRDIMIEGESGLLSVFPPNKKPRYIPSKRLIEFHNGAVGFTYSAEEPEQLRGVQHDLAWIDELCAFRYMETYDQLRFGLRLGNHPRLIITTTPKPIKTIKDIMKDTETFVTRGSTFDNKDNLAPTFIKTVIDKYQGTRLGRQELEGHVLEDNPSALWKRSLLDELRLTIDNRQEVLQRLKKVVVAIDPAVTSDADSDETGIVVVGLDELGQGYLLEDKSNIYTPAEWAQEAIRLYHQYDANYIVAEVNNGGEMIELTLKTYDRNIAYKPVRASKGKYARAEPVAALYEQKRIFHVGNYPELEDQLCEYSPDIAKYSPDRLDALVWGFTELMLNKVSGAGLIDYYRGAIAKSKSADV